MNVVWDIVVLGVALSSSMFCLNYPPAQTVLGGSLLAVTRIQAIWFSQLWSGATDPARQAGVFPSLQIFTVFHYFCSLPAPGSRTLTARLGAVTFPLGC